MRSGDKIGKVISKIRNTGYGSTQERNVYKKNRVVKMWKQIKNNNSSKVFKSLIPTNSDVLMAFNSSF